MVRSHGYLLGRQDRTVLGRREVSNSTFFMIDIAIIRSFREGEEYIHLFIDQLTKQFGEI